MKECGGKVSRTFRFEHASRSQEQDQRGIQQEKEWVAIISMSKEDEDKKKKGGGGGSATM